MNRQLHRKRILITRPSHQAEIWKRRLTAAGALVDCIPMLAITPVNQNSGFDIQRIKNLVVDFDRFDHAIFVSANAVRYGFDWLDSFWPQLPQGPRFYAIGEATAEALEKRGAEPLVDGGAMNSEALLALPQLQTPAGQRVLIFRGCGGRSLLGDTLRARGAHLAYCEVYLRQLPPAACDQLAQYRDTADAITVHSGETLNNLSLCIARSGRTELLATPLICPGKRVAKAAQDAGFGAIYAAVNAGSSAMLEALQRAIGATGHPDSTKPQ